MDTSDDNLIRSYVVVIIPNTLSQLLLGAASFTIYTRTKEYFRDRHLLTRDSMIDASLVGGVSGAMSGALISFGSARESYLQLSLSCF